MDKKEGKVNWEPILKSPAMLNLTQLIRREGLSHVKRTRGLTADQAVEVLKTYAAWLEANPDPKNLENGPPEIPRG